uniref:alpha/beta hydrolase n=2 Tax=Xanthomonas oryzae TaxID=347 RepID=UPI003D9FE122
MSFRALLMLILLAAAKAAHAAEADWSIAGVRGTLSGSFQEATPGAPIVIVVPGSGPSDRNGNVGRLRPDTYRLLADDLSKAEISTLRYDKYGVGKSSALKEEKPPSIGDQAEDVRLWVKEVRSHYPNAKVILLGHSEGALIAELASVEANVLGLVLAEPLGRNVADELKLQLAHTPSTSVYADQADEIIGRLRKGHATDPKMIPVALRTIFSKQAQRYFMDWMSYEPCEALARGHVTTLIIHGTSDLQVDPDESRRLQTCRTGTKLVEIKGMNHLFREVNEDIAKNKKSYLKAVPLDQYFVKTVANFVRDRTR